MKKTLLLLSLLGTSMLGAADEPPAVETGSSGEITISSRGLDVRGVLHDLFTQSKKNYVLEPDIRQVLYLSMAGVKFEEALNIVCDLANLGYELHNGIYFVGKKKSGKFTSAKPESTKKPEQVKPKGKLSDLDLQRRLTTRLSKTDIREVFAEFGRQTGIAIEVSKSVPAYKLDAFLVNTSLKYALDVVTKATGLRYVLTDNLSILIEKPSSKVAYKEQDPIPDLKTPPNYLAIPIL